jgi:hypothetical protein
MQTRGRCHLERIAERFPAQAITSALVAVDISPEHGASKEREQKDNRNHCNDGLCGHGLLQDYGKALTAADQKKI